MSTPLQKNWGEEDKHLFYYLYYNMTLKKSQQFALPYGVKLGWLKGATE